MEIVGQPCWSLIGQSHATMLLFAMQSDGFSRVVPCGSRFKDSNEGEEKHMRAHACTYAPHVKCNNTHIIVKPRTLCTLYKPPQLCLTASREDGSCETASETTVLMPSRLFQANYTDSVD